MIAVITGDIINSRKVPAEIWLPKLKSYFQSITRNQYEWEIYRGDSFQIEVPAESSLEIAMSIKALIKSNHTIDVRMAIGIGDKEFDGGKVSESNGSAYVNSGESFEKLKGDTLQLKSPYKEINEYFNAILELTSFISDNWKPATAETIFYALTNKSLMQKEIAEKLGKDNTTINKALKRGAYDEIKKTLNLFRKKVSKCMGY